MASSKIDFTQSALTDLGSYIIGKIEWTSKSYASSGTSDVTASIYVKKANPTELLTIPTDGKWLYTLVINDKTWRYYVSKSVLTDWVLIASQTYSGIKHGTDGKKRIKIYGSVVAPEDSVFKGLTTSGSENVDLDTITQATTVDSLTCDSDFVNGNITVNYTPQKSEFYNLREVYVNVNNTLTLLSFGYHDKMSAEQHKYTFTIGSLSEIYKASPTTSLVKIRVTFKTYSDSDHTNQIGTDQYQEIELSLPLGVAPTIDEFTVTPENSNSWLKGKGIYVAGLSGATAALTATPGTGASLSATSITHDGTTYNSGGVGVYSKNLPTLKKSGNFNITARAIDTRSRSATVTETITVLQYSAPAVTSMQADRGTYDNGWTADDNGKDVRLVFKTALSLTDYDNAYSATFKIDDSTATASNGATTGLKSASEYTVYFSNIDGETSHTITLTAKDSVGKTGAAKLTIPTVHITMEFNDSGQGIAFGKTSEKDAFECAWDAEFHGAVKRIRDDGSILTLDDTGWIDLGISDSVTTTSSTSAGHYIGCAYRVVNGNHVYVAFNVRAEYSGSAVTVSKEPIPSEYRPKLQPYAVVTLNGKRVSRILVSRTTGHAMIDWIHNVADDTDGTYTPEPEKHTATWIDGYIDYFI